MFILKSVIALKHNQKNNKYKFSFLQNTFVRDNQTRAKSKLSRYDIVRIRQLVNRIRTFFGLK